MAAADYYDDVQKVYVAYYGRPADREGLLYWAGKLDAAHGNLSEIINAFGNSDEAQALFGGMTNAQAVTAIYQQLFNRLPDTEGLDFYVQGLLTGKFTLASVMLDVLNGAKGSDVAIIDAKLAAADAFTHVFFDGQHDTTDVLAYAGNANAELAREWLADVVDSATAATASSAGTLAALITEMGTETPATSFSLSAAAGSVNEGNTAIFTLETTGIAAGTQYTYVISGVNANDVVGGSLTGTATVDASGKAIVAVTLTEDATTEGAETLSLAVAGETTSVTVNDTSLTPVPTFDLSASAADVDEGQTLLFTLDTTHIAAGTQYVYTITGVSADDVVGGSLSGTVTIDASGQAVISVSLTEDATTEGAETVTVTVAGQTADATVNDTSLTPDAQLTTGNDLVVRGLGNDTIIGNSDTYGAADDIDGGDGEDTIELDLHSSAVAYDVGSVKNVEQLLVRTLEVNDGTGDDNVDADVHLLMTNYDSLETLTINQSRADVSVEDLQNRVDVVIDDMRGDVDIEFDQQNAPEFVNVSIREFGQAATGAADNSDLEDGDLGSFNDDASDLDDEAQANKDHDFGNYDADLTIDPDVATVNLTDAGTAGFESDLSIAGGFSTLNIDGGEVGTDLTIYDIKSSAFTGYGSNDVTVDAREFVGDLTVDADAVNTLMTGEGDDTITTDMTYGGDIDAGNGDNYVVIGSTVGEDSEDDDLTGSVTTGSGEDTVLVDDDSEGAISTGAGDDFVEIGAYVGSGDSGGWDIGDLENGATIATGSGEDLVIISDDAYGDVDTGLADDTATDGDVVIVGDDVGPDATITTGAGEDRVFVDDNMDGAITTGSEGDIVGVSGDVASFDSDGDASSLDEVASITTEAGDDWVWVEGTLRDNGTIDTGSDNDNVWIDNGVDSADNTLTDSDALIDLGSGDDELRVSGDMNGDVNLGEGDDDFMVVDGNIGDNVVTIAQIDGGSGSDTLSLVDTDYANNGESNISVSPLLAAISNVETLNLIGQYSADAGTGVDFTVDLAAFDGSLTEVNISNQDDSAESVAVLLNVTEEEITISSEDNGGNDVDLTVTAGGTLSVTLESNIDGHLLDDEDGNDLIDGDDWLGNGENEVAEGNTDFDVDLHDAADATANLNLTNNGTAIDEIENDKGRTLALDSEDFTGTLTIDGNMTNDREAYAESDTRLRDQQDGNLLMVTGIAAHDIVSTDYAGDLNLVLAVDQDYDIELGSGDDVVDMQGDDLSTDDVVDFGDGIDRLIVDETTQSTGDDSDEVFNQLISLEELEIRGNNDAADAAPNGTLEVSLDDDAFRSDIARVIVAAADGAQGASGGDDAANVLLDIGADFWNDLTDEGRDLRIEANSGVLAINNDSDNDLTIYTDTGTAGGYADDEGRDILISQNGEGTTNVFIGVDEAAFSGDYALIGAGYFYDRASYTEGAQDVSSGATYDGEIELDMFAGELTSITLLDNPNELYGADTLTENNDVELVVASNWASSELTIDARDITDNDGDNDTGGLLLRGGMETDADLTVEGTANDDIIQGGQQADTLNGYEGDDLIIGDPTGPVLEGIQQVSTVTFQDDSVVLDTGDTYTVTVDGTDYTYTVVSGGSGGESIDDVISALADMIASGEGSHIDVFADTVDNVITLVGNTTYTDELTGEELDLGESFTVSADAANSPSQAQISEVTLADEAYDIGDTVTVTIGGTGYTVTVGADTAGATDAASIATALQGAINSDLVLAVTAGAVDNVLTLTGDVSGAAFTVAAGVTDTATLLGQVVSVDVVGLDEGLSGNGADGDTLSITVGTQTVSLQYDFDTYGGVSGSSSFEELVAAIGVEVSNLTGEAITAVAVDADTFTLSSAAGVEFTTPTFTIFPAGSASATTLQTATTEVTDNTDPSIETTQTASTLGANDTNLDPTTDTLVDAVAAVETDSAGAGDHIDGGEGDNALFGITGNDVIVAGNGDNYVEGGVGNDQVTLGNGDNEVYGEDGNDEIEAGNGANYVEGGNGADEITLGDANEEGADNGVLFGVQALNVVYGDVAGVALGGGNDTIVTGNGDDWINGGFGADSITAGEGNNVYDYDFTTDSTGANLGFDTIHGFNTGTEQFDLNTLAIDTLGFTGVTFLGNFETESLANTAIATSATTDLEVVLVNYYTPQQGNFSYLYADTNANGSIDSTDLAIKLVGVDTDVALALTDSNFVGV